MKRSIVHSILFCVLFSFISFIIGGIIGAQIVPKGSGLAGPAEVVMYAFIGLFAGLGLGILLMKSLSSTHIKKANLIMSMAAAICFIWLFVRMKANKKDIEKSPVKRETTLGKVSAGSIENNFDLHSNRVNNDQKYTIGMGMVQPILSENTALYFYDISKKQRIDSIVFHQNKHYIDIKTAPPWFVPETMKLDYQILFLKAISLRSDWIQVEVNKINGRLGWISRASVSYYSWEDFLLNVHSIEPLDINQNPVRVKAHYESSALHFDREIILSPYEVKGEWIGVKVLSEDYEELATGWIQWRKDGQLNVSYSLLS